MIIQVRNTTQEPEPHVCLSQAGFVRVDAYLRQDVRPQRPTGKLPKGHLPCRIRLANSSGLRALPNSCPTTTGREASNANTFPAGCVSTRKLLSNVRPICAAATWPRCLAKMCGRGAPAGNFPCRLRELQ